MAEATPEHLQGCLQETSNSGTEAPTQESPAPPRRPSPPSCLVSFVPICPAGFALICHVPGRASTGEGEREPDGERIGGSSHGEDGGDQQEPGLPKAVQT